ncbi:MAG TPA: gephyrin-like molybdotransferase Glp [Thermomicrobiales bacterium]|nr:gephyrin-like molybdotransferase Glp [Thermomicrobiales bacterium]
MQPPRRSKNPSNRDLDRLRSPDEARATILARVPTLGIERVALHQAPWRVLAEDLIAPEDHPPFPAATMDGFAIIADDGSPWREIVGDQMAGNVIEQQVTPGTAIRITTGAPVPTGADAVIPVEQTEIADDHVVIHGADLRPGANIRPVGADLRRGDHLLTAGTLLGPAELGLVASAGLVPVPVRRRPRVSVISTGDELIEPGERVGPGQIRDSNRFSLIAALEAEGADIRWAGHAPDARGPLNTLLLDRIASDDVVITSGGVSMGELDLVKALLVELARVHFRRVFMKPGKPFTFATAGEHDDVLVFGLPGNPVSALAGFELFVRPALATMARRTGWERPCVPVTLSHPVRPSDRIEYQRATVRVHPDGYVTGATTGGQGSSRLVSWVGANALLIIPPRESIYAEGERVEAMLLGAPYGPA